MKLFNTLGRQLQEFKPATGKQVKLYTCGPTVYDYAHIGNLRSFVFDDTLRRVLEASGNEVNQVMNITDVGHLTSDADEGEDKLEKGAAREGKTVREVAEFYTKSFLDDAKALNILPPKTYAKATDYIEAMLDIVGKLLEKGYAYKTEQAIYFDVTKLTDYGKLTGQKLQDKETAVRAEVHADPNKHHPQDFALWFFTSGRYADHEMRWSSEWGEGFPGWHLECSAIIHATLGEPVDIHTGGVDHIGTHHTNEIAQTEAAYDKELAHFWLHNEHLLVENKRMAKSSGNFYRLSDVRERGYDALALRLLFLQSHYRNQMNFSWDSLAGAQSYLLSLQAWADLVHQTEVQKPKVADLTPVKQALAKDLNTPEALAALAEVTADSLPTPEVLEELDKLFGLGLAGRPDITNHQKKLIKERETARANSDWAKADELRKELSNDNLELDDTDNGPVWRRTRPS